MDGRYGRAGGRDGRWRQAGRGCGPHDPILSIMPHALAHRAWLQPWASLGCAAKEAALQNESVHADNRSEKRVPLLDDRTSVMAGS